MKKQKVFIIITIEIMILIILEHLIKSNYLEFIPPCWVYQKLGILCPACGGTRCVIYLMQGKWIEAFFSHMIFFIGILYLLFLNVAILINLGKEKKIATWLYPKCWYPIIFAIVLILYTVIRNFL